jgi:hypothetical protein
MAISSSHRVTVLRPFEFASDFDGLIDADLTHGLSGLIYEDKTHQEEELFESGILQIRLEVDKSRLKLALEKSKLSAGDLRLEIFSTGKFLKVTDFLKSISAQELLSSEALKIEVEVARFPDSLGDSFRGYELTIALILTQEKAGGVLDFKHVGTWLDLKRWLVLPKKSGVGLNPQPMDNEKKSELKLPSWTFAHTEIVENLLPQAGPGAVRFWLDSDYYDELFLMRKTNVGRAMQKMLQMNVMSSLVYQLGIELRPLSDSERSQIVEDSLDSEVSLLRGMLKSYNKGTFKDLDAQEFALAILSNPEEVISRIEPKGFLAEQRKGLSSDD